MVDSHITPSFNSDNYNIAEMVRQRAIHTPAAPAILFGDKIFDYGTLDTGSKMLAEKLSAAGVKPKDHVGISMGQSVLHVMLILAIAELGAVSMTLSSSLPATARQRVATKFNVSMVVSANEKYRIAGLPFFKTAGLEIDAEQADPERTLFSAEPDTPFRIALTSGTTADPKGLLFSHGYMHKRIEQTNYACSETTRMLPMDLNFTIGFVFALGVLKAGGVLVIPKSYKPEALARAINLHAVTHFLLSPAQAETFCKALPDRGPHFPSLKHLRIVGDTPNEKLIDCLTSRCTPAVYLPYGSTEMGPVSIATPEDLAMNPGSSGPLFPWAKVEIIDESGEPVAAGQTGELRIQVEGMPTGYLLDPERTAQHFRGGWYYPGDQGYLSEQGQLFLTGRADDTINLGGEKILPKTIETQLNRHPNIGQSVVFSHRVNTGEEVLAAAITLLQQPVGDLQDYCENNIGKMSPKLFVVLNDIPQTGNGKIDRKLTKALALERLNQHNNND